MNDDNATSAQNSVERGIQSGRIRSLWKELPALLRAALFVLFLFWGTTMVLALVPARVLFTVTAQSDRVEFVTDDFRRPIWSIPRGVVSTTTKSRAVENVLFQPAGRTRVIVQRVEAGPLLIVATSGDSTSAGSLLSSNEEPLDTLASVISIEFDSRNQARGISDGLVLAADGLIVPLRVGRVLRTGVEGAVGLVRSGEIVLLARSWPGREPYLVKELPLQLGDQVDFSDEQATSSILISVGEQVGLSIAFHTVARQVNLFRAGSSSFPVRAVVLDRYRFDPFWQTTATTLAFFVGLAVFMWDRARSSNTS